MSATTTHTLAQSSTTRLLAALVAILAITAAVAFTRLGGARSAAAASERDLRQVQADLRDLATWHATGRVAGDAAAADPELSRRIRDAATTAAIGEQLASIEPGTPARVRDSDTLRTPIYLRLDGVTLRQVVTFARELTTADATLRATGVELSAPALSAPAAGQELWTADVTLSQSTLGTRERLP